MYIAPIGSTVPNDLETPWAVAWTPLGYTNEGSEFVFDQSFDNVEVAEELDPVNVIQTARETTINFALAEMTAANLQRALNGGVITTPGGVTKFEPPSVGSVTEQMIGWEADDGLERWVFRRCRNVGSVSIPRRKGADKAILPMSFRALKPTGAAAFVFLHDPDFVSNS